MWWISVPWICTMDLCSCSPRRIFSKCFLWQSVLLPCIFEGSFWRHFVPSPWLLSRVLFCLTFFYTDIFVFSFLWDRKSTIMLSPAIHLYVFSGLFYRRPWLSSLRILSWLLSDCLRDLMVPFLLVAHVAFPNLLSRCMTVFLVLFVVCQCLCRGLVLWCYDRCWSHSAPLSSLSFCPGPFLLVLWCQCWIRYLCIHDMSMVVRAHLLLEVWGSTVLPRWFLPSGSDWGEPQVRFRVYVCTAHYAMLLR